MAKNLFIIGNWKMNPNTLGEAKDILGDIRRSAVRAKCAYVIIAPPSPFIFPLWKKKSPIALSVQDVSKDNIGAHTGEISAKMARSAGALYAIIGHSERRAAGDTDEIVTEKFIRSIEAGLVPILCVGEKKRDQDGDYFAEIARQLSIVLKPATKTKIPKFIVAYEPVWAIGGAYDKALSPEEMQAMAIFIKKILAQFLPKNKAMKIPVLYGGSVDNKNATPMLTGGGIDGFLIGRISLDQKRFGEIIKFACE